MIERDFSALLFALHDANVEFLVVGGLAAVLNGTPVHTYDVDVVHRRTPQNVDRPGDSFGAIMWQVHIRMTYAGSC